MRTLPSPGTRALFFSEILVQVTCQGSAWTYSLVHTSKLLFLYRNSETRLPPYRSYSITAVQISNVNFFFFFFPAHQLDCPLFHAVAATHKFSRHVFHTHFKCVHFWDRYPSSKITQTILFFSIPSHASLLCVLSLLDNLYH